MFGAQACTLQYDAAGASNQPHSKAEQARTNLCTPILLDTTYSFSAVHSGSSGKLTAQAYRTLASPPLRQAGASACTAGRIGSMSSLFTQRNLRQRAEAQPSRPTPTWRSAPVAAPVSSQVISRSPCRLPPHMAEHVVCSAAPSQTAAPSQPTQSRDSTSTMEPATERISLKDTFLPDKPWAQAIVQMQQDVREQVARQLEPLQLQPTKYTDDGELSVWSLDGKNEFNVTTYSGTTGIIKHLYQSCNMMPSLSMLHTKTSIHACMEYGTPFLDLELGGNDKSMLLAICFTPRQALLRHNDYNKYYRGLPSGMDGAGAGLVPFTQIYTRMTTRVAPPATPGVAMISDPTGKGSSGTVNVYSHFNSRQLWSRLMAGHSAMFTFNPMSQESLAAVREDVTAIVSLWCAWVKSDITQGKPLEGSRLEECKDFSRNMANFLESDEDAAFAERMVGPEGMTKLKQTLSGVASLAGPVWWST